MYLRSLYVYVFYLSYAIFDALTVMICRIPLDLVKRTV